MNTDSIDWINGSYAIAKSSKWLYDIVGTTQGLGYLTMHEYARMAHDNKCLARLLGYWESPRHSRACTFVVVKPHGNMPYVFVPDVEVHIRDHGVNYLKRPTYAERVEYACRAVKPGTVLVPGWRKWREYFADLNAPAKYWGASPGVMSRKLPLDAVKGGCTCWPMPIPQMVPVELARDSIIACKQHTNSRQAK